MKCPKCNADLNEDAKFCHVCGYQIVAQEAQAAPQETVPAQEPQTTEPAQAATPTPPQQQAPVNENPMAGFNIKEIPKYNLVIAAGSVAAATMVILPWMRVKNPKFEIFGFFSQSDSSYIIWGLQSGIGDLIFITLLSIAFFAILGKRLLKMSDKVIEPILKFGPMGAAGLCLIDFLRIFVKMKSVPYGSMSVSASVIPHIGWIFVFLITSFLTLYALKVIKIKALE